VPTDLFFRPLPLAFACGFSLLWHITAKTAMIIRTKAEEAKMLLRLL